jgi:hypothetical protein
MVDSGLEAELCRAFGSELSICRRLVLKLRSNFRPWFFRCHALKSNRVDQVFV